jgi:hypothetical protein
MKEILEIQPTPISPAVYLDLLKEEFRISGRSMPEDSDAFFEQVKTWMRKHLSNTRITANFDLFLEYYNTGTYIRLMEIFDLLEELNRGGCKFTVRWLYESDDPDSRDDGESLKEIVKVPFEIVEVD